MITHLRHPSLISVAALLGACQLEQPAESSTVAVSAGDSAICLAVGADYQNGVGTLAGLSLPSLRVTRQLLQGVVTGDPVLRADGERVFVMNRQDGNVTLVDGATYRYRRQIATGHLSNPQDAAVANGKLYVALFGSGKLPVFDAATGRPVTEIDLSGYDEDGVPNAASVNVVGDLAYVTLELLDENFAARGPGKVVVVDTKTDTIVQDFDLNFANPIGFLYSVSGKLVVSTVDDFSGLTGCIEAVVPGVPAATGACLVDNSALGGTVSSIAAGGGELFLAVSAFTAEGQVATIRRVGATGELQAQPMTPADQLPTDVAYAPSGHLVYADSASGGLRVYDLAQGKEITTEPLSIGLAPAFANGIVCRPR
jgi:PQQ-like domain